MAEIVRGQIASESLARDADRIPDLRHGSASRRPCGPMPWRAAARVRDLPASYDLTLLTTPDVPWDADGRCVPGAGTFSPAAKAAPRAAGRSFVVITGG